MSRALVPGLATPHPLGERLPAMYLEDSFVQRLSRGLDEVLAPVLSCLDNLDAYLDPDLAPDDFLPWLASWFGLALDESWSPERLRAVLVQAAALYRVRGTAAGMGVYLRLLTGADVQVVETGGTSHSTGADPTPPGSPGFALIVRLRPADGQELDPARIDALVAANKPAHVVHRVEILPAQPPPGGEPVGPDGPPPAVEPAEPEPLPPPQLPDKP